MCVSNSSKMRYSGHALQRSNERQIDLDKGLSYEDVCKLPVYNTDNGCTKYLDVKKQVVYYVRGKRIVTLIKTNPIQMLKYYAFGKKLNFNNLCRDHAFGNCNRNNCKFVHVDFS